MSHLRWIAVCGVVLALSGELFAAPPVPRTAPEFTLTDPSGKTLSLASYKGRVVLLQFLYTSCPHCQATSSRFAKLQSEMGSRGLQVVGIAFNEEIQRDPAAIRAYAELNGVNFPVGLAPRGAVLGFLRLSVMSRFVVPQIVVIDRKGVIRAQSDEMGSDELQDEARLRPLLDKLLGEASTTKTKRPTAARTSKAAAN